MFYSLFVIFFQLPRFFFDGTVMLTTSPVYPHAQKDFLELDSSRDNRLTNERDHCTVKIKLVGEVNPTDHHYLQVLWSRKNAQLKLDVRKVSENWTLITFGGK